MASSTAWTARAGGAILAILVVSGRAAAQEPLAGSQGRTDVVTLPNGDRITGEVVRLDRGRLEFKTDDAGTLYLEWDKVATVQATRAVEVVTEDGRRILGSLGPAASRSLTVVGEAESISVGMAEVTIIRQIGSSFWSKLDGGIDAGYSYTITRYGSRGRPTVEYYEVAKMGHAWSGGKDDLLFSDAKGPDASRLMWDFFKQFSR